MIVVCIADTHEKHRQIGRLPFGDVLIHAGDMTYVGDPRPTLDFLDWFEKQPFQHKIFVAGNHDYFFQDPANLSALKDRKVHYLMSSSLALEDPVLDQVRIWGSPITPEFNDWTFMETREKIGAVWQQIPSNLDILITHGPPFGILDRNSGGLNVGCSALLETVKVKKPKIHVFGHIHEGYGIVEKNGTIFINASLCNANYNLVNKPIVVEL